ncbi:MAG TPA: 30S ribosomal protein S17 [Bacilli bacterium]|jgi:small subunit ribosomal protein S17|nr:30S ribosomal protein S17 [Bacilli bacterium]
MENRTSRRTFTGTVVSAKSDKTIVVRIETYRKHPKYSKRVLYTKKFVAHDETNSAHEGDIVEIMETRPLSATKRYRLIKIIQTAVENIEIKEVE